MRRAKRWLLIFAALLGLMSHGGALRPSFSKSTTTSTTTTTTSTEATSEATTVPEEETTSKPHTNATSKPTKKLTGIPQIDYIWDPNLPRELRGYNLSSYPFFSAVPPPEDIAFQCNGLHDGFYASIEYKCQVYHHCIYGIRHDFLCANFTAFDQRTFICHFVSEVDCKNSEKFWNRNDNLYMATTPKTTTTTATEPPPTPEYRPRPRRPLRRRRPSDYYYDDDYYEDDYEEDRRANRRRKHRPRGRRPSEYDEDYEERRSYSDEEPRLDKRPKNRDRFRNDEEEDYVDDRRSRPRNRPKTSAMGRQGDLSERRKLPNGRKSLADRQSSLDERRSLSEDKPKNKLDDPADVVEQRPLLGRRRHNGERRPPPVDDDLDKPNRRSEAEEEDKSLEPSVEKVEKVEKELVRPTTSSSKSSIYDRPRVPPRIPRPVPINEKKKYEYPAQKSTTSTANPLSDEYYDDYEYDDVASAKDNFPPADPIDSKDSPRRRLQDDLTSRRAEDFPLRRTHSQSRRGNDDFPRKPGRPFQRKPLEQTKPVDDYDLSKEKEDLDERPLPRKRPHTFRDQDIDETEEDLRDHRPRIRETLRRPLKKVEPIDEDRGHRRDNRRRPIDSDRSQVQVPSPLAEPSKETDEIYDEKLDDSLDSDRSSAISESEKPNQRDGRPVIRVVKRPFLPSRGGSPHLPRGLQPVGAAQRKSSTESTPIDMGSTISGVRLLEHGAPIVRDHAENKGPRTTLPPQIEHPKSSLDELYENDYDVTLNDALNPTIKPLSSSNRNSLSPFNKYERAGYSAPASSSYSSDGDSYFSSTDVRRRTIAPSRNTRQEFRGASRIAQHFYDDFDY